MEYKEEIAKILRVHNIILPEEEKAFQEYLNNTAIAIEGW